LCTNVEFFFFTFGNKREQSVVWIKLNMEHRVDVVPS